MLTPPIITVGRMIRRMPAKRRDSYVIDDLRSFEKGTTITAHRCPKCHPAPSRALVRRPPRSCPAITSITSSCSVLLLHIRWVERTEAQDMSAALGGVGLAHRDLARQETDHAFEQSAERRANGVGEIESGLLKYAFCMAESLEAFVAVVGAHTARSDAAKWNVLLSI